MNDSAYRVILTGELLPGFERAAAVTGIARLFNVPPEAARRALELGDPPVNQLFSADDALQTQHRLERMGVGSRIERTNQQRTALHGSDSTCLEPGKMRCPACGQIQMVSAACAACGINFEDYNRQRREGRVPAAPPNRPPPPVASDRHQSSWQQAASEFEDEVEPDEQDHLALFVGARHVTNYVPAFRRYRDGERVKFALGWNWGAVVSPFLWAMQRKLWSWAMIMLITEIVIPASLIILGTRPGMPGHIAMLGGVLLVVNRFVWPALVNYLYYRHARATIRRLERMSATRLHESDIVEAGGVSVAGAFVGLCMAGMSVLFSWHLIDSLGIGKTAFARGEYYVPGLPVDAGRGARPLRRPPTAPPQQIAGPNESSDRAALERSPPIAAVPPNPPGHALNTPPRVGQGAGGRKRNKWVATRSKLRSLGSSINDRLLSKASEGMNPMSLTVSKLREKLALGDDGMLDAWGSEIKYIPEVASYRLISAGPDQLYGTADDLRYTKTLKR